MHEKRSKQCSRAAADSRGAGIGRCRAAGRWRPVALLGVLGLAAPAAWANVNIAITQLDPGSRVGEGGTVTVTVTVSEDGTQPVVFGQASSVSLAFTIANGSGDSATLGVDYSGLPRRESLSLPGDAQLPLTFTYQLPIAQDSTVEGDEFFTVNIVQASGAALSDSVPLAFTPTVGGPATVTIADDDQAPAPPPGQDPSQALLALAATPPQRELARVIGIVCPQGIASADLQRDCNQLLAGAVSPDSTIVVQSANALAQLTPDQAGTPSNAAQSTVNVQARNVGARLAALRHGASGVQLGLLGLNPGRLAAAERDELPGTLGLGRGGGASADGGGLDFGRLGVFVNGTFDFGDKDATANEEGFETETRGVTAGVDYRFSDNLVLGAALGYLATDTDLDDNGGNLDSDGYSLSLYGTWYQSERFYLEGSLTYGRNDYDQSRNIRYTLGSTIVEQAAFADFDGEQWDVMLGGGYEFHQGGWTFGPVGRLEYIKIDVDGYSEQMSSPSAAGSGWAVQIDDQTLKSFTLSLGGQVSYAMSQSWGVLVPQANAQWVHEFEDDSRFITGRLIGDPSGQSFNLPTDSVDRNYFTVGIGASAVFPQGASAYLFYQKVLGYEDFDLDSVNLGVRWEF
ncbi:MAG TPA: autotransporter outer membrane beta-barrel domain-containing protein [Candidatus Competibacteraceae bacterium]|nr:autotransporter outer membrane beta-barrel domain-containing protein [Candidatus Competibacteraceae bacterium]